VIYSEEVVGMLLGYFKMLAEIQSQGSVRECVITVPSWFTYEQKKQIKDAAENLAGLSVLAMVSENTAAAVMMGIEKKQEENLNEIIMFYNMGSMDTEVQVVRYSSVNLTDKKTAPLIEVLSETYDSALGSKEIDIIIVNLLAEKFNKLAERKDKPDVRTNVRATKRMFKEATKIKEILSSNKFASVKIPELLDYVSLQTDLQREEVEQAAKSFFDRVSIPAQEALSKAGLTIGDISAIEVLGGGVRVPKVAETLKNVLGKDVAFHLNGDEAMCFGSAFIASNSSSAYKVKQIFLTQNPSYSIQVRVSPLHSEDFLTKEDQIAEGVDEEDIVNYKEEIAIFNSSDYLGKYKGLSLNYDKDMKIEVFKTEAGETHLIETFILDDLKKQF
jgi:hypoxia up-regulated 1